MTYHRREKINDFLLTLFHSSPNVLDIEWYIVTLKIGGPTSRVSQTESATAKRQSERLLQLTCPLMAAFTPLVFADRKHHSSQINS